MYSEKLRVRNFAFRKGAWIEIIFLFTAAVTPYGRATRGRKKETGSKSPRFLFLRLPHAQIKF